MHNTGKRARGLGRHAGRQAFLSKYGGRSARVYELSEGIHGLHDCRHSVNYQRRISMQLVKTQRDTLLRPLQIVSGIVERRHTLPILANILIRKDGENVSFLSTDTRSADHHARRYRLRRRSQPPPRSPRASCSTSCARCRIGRRHADPAEQTHDRPEPANRALRCRRWRPKNSRPSRRPTATTPTSRCRKRR